MAMRALSSAQVGATLDQAAVQGFGVALVIASVRGAAKGEAVHVVSAAFNPPPVENAQVRNALEHRFHPGGPGRLERTDRVVEPEVNAAGEQPPVPHGVVRDQDDAEQTT